MRNESDGCLGISVLMPAYNEEKYIEAAVASIFTQVYPMGITVELVVVDDFSTDATLELLRETKEKTGWNIQIHSNKNKGKNSAFNLAFSKSNGSYICLMGGDDLIVPSVLVKRARAVESLLAAQEDKNFGVSYCKIKTFSQDLAFDGIVIPRESKLGSKSGGAIMMSRPLAGLVFPLPEMLPNEDTWIAAFLSYKRIGEVHVPEIGLNYRIHSGNSHRRDIGFSEFKNQMWIRARALIYFYARHGASLEGDQEKKLLLAMIVEMGKYLGWSVAWLFLNGISWKDKLKAISQSTKLGYYLKKKYYKHLVGR